MFTTTKLLGIFTILTILLLVAVQCGAQPTELTASVTENGVTEEATQAITAEQVTEDATQEEKHVDEEHDPDGATELAPVSLEAGEKLKVIATNSLVADIVSNVGGDLIDLTFLMPLGSDPHSFQATPQDVANVAEAHVLFANGLGLEEFLNELIENAGGKVGVVSLSTGLELREMSAEEEHEEQSAEAIHEEHRAEGEHKEHGAETNHPGVDPHTWTTPANTIIFVHNIEQALSALDPANAETYQANAEAYGAKLAELDAWVKAQIETIPAQNRKLVTDHTVFGYYADRYGLEQVGAVIPSFSTTAEPSAQEMAELEDVISKQGVKVIFVGNTVSPGLEQRVAEDTGIQLVTLYTESLGPEGSGAENYIDYIRSNTMVIVEALK
jgi:ABC-type Zn uptake system ZnuABC Zn-binding protein ZnuA